MCTKHHSSFSLFDFDQGVQVETPEERKRMQVAKTIREVESMIDDEVSYVLVPSDRSKPLSEFRFRPSDYVRIDEQGQRGGGGGDFLLQHLKPAFSAKIKDNQTIDIELLKKNTQTTLASSAGLATDSVSDETLRQVAADANIEVFSLVKPLPANDFTGINIYLDEGKRITLVLCCFVFYLLFRRS